MNSSKRIKRKKTDPCRELMEDNLLLRIDNSALNKEIKELKEVATIAGGFLKATYGGHPTWDILSKHFDHFATLYERAVGRSTLA